MPTPGSLLLYGRVTFYLETWKFLARHNLAMFSLLGQKKIHVCLLSHIKKI